MGDTPIIGLRGGAASGDPSKRPPSPSHEQLEAQAKRIAKTQRLVEISDLPPLQGTVNRKKLGPFVRGLPGTASGDVKRLLLLATAREDAPLSFSTTSETIQQAAKKVQNWTAAGKKAAREEGGIRAKLGGDRYSRQVQPPLDQFSKKPHVESAQKALEAIENYERERNPDSPRKKEALANQKKYLQEFIASTYRVACRPLFDDAEVKKGDLEKILTKKGQADELAISVLREMVATASPKELAAFAQNIAQFDQGVREKVIPRLLKVQEKNGQVSLAPKAAELAILWVKREVQSLPNNPSADHLNALLRGRDSGSMAMSAVLSVTMQQWRIHVLDPFIEDLAQNAPPAARFAEELSEEAFNYYSEKIPKFITELDAQLKNHAQSSDGVALLKEFHKVVKEGLESRGVEHSQSVADSQVLSMLILRFVNPAITTSSAVLKDAGLRQKATLASKLIQSWANNLRPSGEWERFALCIEPLLSNKEIPDSPRQRLVNYITA